MPKRPFLWSAIASFLLASGISHAEEFKGKVVGVTDGDTIQVMRQGAPERVRLAGIDCPEFGQSYGSRAKQMTSALAFGEQVTVKTQGKDKYGRTLGEVILPDGRSLNKELVRQGMAWWYRQYSSDPELHRAEVEARQRRLGLWNDPNAVAPWDWRHGRTSSNQAVTKEPGASQAAQSVEQTVYVTRTGTKYHRAGCRYLRGGGIPMPLKEAMQRYSPCSVCNPGTETSRPSAAKASEANPDRHGETLSGDTTRSGQPIYVGPRGGRYHYSKSGKKVYERRRR
jgi:micrococcal nuclease